MEDSHYFTVSFNINFGEKLFLLSSLHELNNQIIGNTEEAIKKAKKANDNLQSSTVIVDLNQLRTIFKIGENTKRLEDKVKDFLVDIEKIDLNCNIEQNLGITNWEEIEDEYKTFGIEKLSPSEKLLFANQFYSISLETETFSELSRGGAHYLFRMDKPNEPMKII